MFGTNVIRSVTIVAEDTRIKGIPIGVSFMYRLFVIIVGVTIGAITAASTTIATEAVAISTTFGTRTTACLDQRRVFILAA
jgi:hypothetical protein